MIATIVVIAKQPVPGRVKTRLIGTVSAEQAAELARCAVLDTLQALDELHCANRVILLDGSPEGWVPGGWSVILQSGGGLDERLSAGFDQLPAGAAVLVGMDTPQVRVELLDFDPSRYDACLGLAIDGGYWAIGFADPKRARDCIAGVPMSTERTGAEQYRRLIEAGLSVQLLPELVDVDTADSAAAVAESVPNSRFARLWNEIDPVTAVPR